MEIKPFGLIQVPANSCTCLSVPGCRALCSSPGLCAVTPRSSPDIYCQLKASASFLTIHVCTKPQPCACGENCQGISENSLSGARAVPAGAGKPCWGQRAPSPATRRWSARRVRQIHYTRCLQAASGARTEGANGIKLMSSDLLSSAVTAACGHLSAPGSRS